MRTQLLESKLESLDSVNDKLDLLGGIDSKLLRIQDLDSVLEVICTPLPLQSQKTLSLEILTPYAQ